MERIVHEDAIGAEYVVIWSTEHLLTNSLRSFWKVLQCLQDISVWKDHSGIIYLNPYAPPLGKLT